MIFKSNWDSVFNILNSIAAKHNVEIAFPFFSKPFVEHCLNMPTSKRYLKALQDIISEKACKIFYQKRYMKGIANLT